MNVSEEFLEHIRDRYDNIKQNGEKAMQQLTSDDQFHWMSDKTSNSIAILVNHLRGNMRSRWTDIFTTDGEKHDRNRPQEFDITYSPTRDELFQRWEDGWQIFFTTFDSLQPDDLLKTIYIRKEPHSVIQALLRQLPHYAAHIGQIILLTKMQLADDFETLSIPRSQEVFDYKELDK